MRKNLIISVLFIFIISITSFAADTRVITELDGTKVTIPVNPKRIACAYNPAYDKVIMLSQASRLVLIPKSVTLWAKKFYPELTKLETGQAGTVPDPERLLQLKVDLVIYPKRSSGKERAAQYGIPLVCPFNLNYVPENIDAYTIEFQKQISFFADVLGGDAKQKADKYNKYLVDVTKRVKAITSKIKEADKPKVYYGHAANFYSSQGNNSIMHWYTELAGGIYLPKKFSQYFATTSREEVIGWDPDIIMIGMNASTRTGGKAKISDLDKLRAHKEGKVYNVPLGIFYWEMTSCETALLPIFLGKKFHPKLFADWDLIKEMKKFYSEIYGVKITDRDAELILNALPPES